MENDAYQMSESAKEAVLALLVQGVEVSFAFVSFHPEAPILAVNCVLGFERGSVSAWGNTMTKALERARQ